MLPTRDRRLPGPHLDAGISVIVPTCAGAERIGKLLDSLARQSLDPRLFEVVVVINGPENGVSGQAARLAQGSRAPEVRVLTSDRMNAPAAYGLGLAAAAREYCTFIDDDDHVSPGYLSGLLSHAGPWTVVAASIGDVLEDGSGDPDWDNYIQRALEHLSGEVHADECSQTLGYNAGKLVSTRLARQAQFNTTLSSGQDVLFWTELMGRFALTVTVVPRDEEVHYYRSVRPASLSRGRPQGTFVDDRITVLAHLTRMRHSYPSLGSAIRRTLMLGQVNLLANYAEAHPAEHAEILARVLALSDPAIPVRPLELVSRPSPAVKRIEREFTDPPAPDRVAQ